VTRWGGRRAQALTRLVLARDHDPTLGYPPCRWCGAPATTADHWPVARMDGGPDDPANLIAACLTCNTSRGATLGNRARTRPAPPSRQW
jgi:HNH endonuclease